MQQHDNKPRAQTINLAMAFKRSFDFNLNTLQQLGKHPSFEGLAISEAIKRVRKECEHYGTDLVVQLVQRVPDEYPAALTRLEARLALLMRYTGLPPTTLRTLCVQEPLLIACPHTHFITILTKLKEIIPLPKALGLFVETTPSVCARINPLFIDELHKNGLIAAWRKTSDARLLLADQNATKERHAATIALLSDMLRITGHTPHEQNTVETLSAFGWKPHAQQIILQGAYGKKVRMNGAARLLKTQVALQCCGFSQAEAIYLICHAPKILSHPILAILRVMPGYLGSALRVTTKRIQENAEMIFFIVEHSALPRTKKPQAPRLPNKYIEERRRRMLKEMVTKSQYATTTEAAFHAAEWQFEDAAQHCAAFPAIVHIPPPTLALSLMQLSMHLDLKGPTLTRRLQRMAWLMERRHQRLWGELPLAVGWGYALAISIHRLADSPIDEVVDASESRANSLRQAMGRMVSLQNGSIAGNASINQRNLAKARLQLRRAPEWLANDFQAIRVAAELQDRWKVSREVMRQNVAASWTPVILLEPIETIRRGIMAFRTIATQHMHINAEYFDPLRDWQRLCLPFRTLQRRWEILAEVHPALLQPFDATADALYLPRHAEFAQRLEEIIENAGDTVDVPDEDLYEPDA